VSSESDDLLRVDTDTSDARVRVAVAGEVDPATAPRLEAALDAAVATGRQVVVDLSEVSFMDSSGLRVLLAACQPADDPRDIVLANPSPTVKRLLEITGLDAQLPIEDGRA
jgi:stage II sporulation protein AA (anti-sigma F factor antagonist)